MENPIHLAAANEIEVLKEGIKKKYEEYHSKDEERFPELTYNTNRANYQPLKDSFEEEFYVVRGVDRIKNDIHIPSTSILEQIFNNNYVPSKKIIKTCRSYAKGQSKVTFNNIVLDIVQPEITATPKNTFANWIKIGLVIVIGLIILTSLSIYIAANHQDFIAPPSGLVIERPANGNSVPMIAFAEGRVSNANMVWIVVLDVKTAVYYVQHPIKVKHNGVWRGAIHIGGRNKAHIGARVQIRAFVNPAKELKLGDILYSWPEAQLSSKAVEAVRGPEVD